MRRTTRFRRRQVRWPRWCLRRARRRFGADRFDLTQPSARRPGSHRCRRRGAELGPSRPRSAAKSSAGWALRAAEILGCGPRRPSRTCSCYLRVHDLAQLPHRGCFRRISAAGNRSAGPPPNRGLRCLHAAVMFAVTIRPRLARLRAFGLQRRLKTNSCSRRDSLSDKSKPWATKGRKATGLSCA